MGTGFDAQAEILMSKIEATFYHKNGIIVWGLGWRGLENTTVRCILL